MEAREELVKDRRKEFREWMKSWSEEQKQAALDWEDSVMIAPEEEGGAEAQEKRDALKKEMDEAFESCCTNSDSMMTKEQFQAFCGVVNDINARLNLPTRNAEDETYINNHWDCFSRWGNCWEDGA